MEYEMRIPPGVSGQMLASVMEKYDVDVKQTENGPVLVGKMEDLENARDEFVRSLNERISELEGKKE
jgi:hypothetical protein